MQKDIWTQRVLKLLNTPPATTAKPDDGDQPWADQFRDETTNDLIVPDYPARSDYLDLIIGAAVLDASGIDDRILDGTHILIVQDDSKVGGCVKEMLVALFKGRVTLNPVSGRDIGIVLDDAEDKTFTALWQSCATVIGIGRVSKLPPSLVEMSDSMRILMDLDEPATFGRIFRAVTRSDHYLSLDDVYVDATVEWTQSVLRHGISVDEALDRIRRRIRAAEKRSTAKINDDMDDLEAMIAESAAPIGDAAADVVKRLSAMTGFGAAKEWGLQLAADLRDYKDGRIGWHDVDKGVLLSGPPGCGKTTFANALALECGLPLVVSTYSDWHGNSVGGDSVCKELKKQFTAWKKKAASGPFLLFLDELDSIGTRGANGHNDSWFGPIINAWLAFLDGANGRDGIIVIAATNHADKIDPALRRPGRLDRHVVIPAPGVAELPGIVRHHLGFHDARAARACRGMTPAEIQMACRDARRIARRARRRVTADDLVQAVRGSIKPHGVDPWRAALHESGHALVAHLHRVQIDFLDIDRGYVHVGKSNMFFERDFHHNIGTLLAGRAAEHVVLGEPSTLCVADIEAATATARTLHTRGGLGAAGLLHIDEEHFENRIATEAAVKKTLDAVYATTFDLVRKHHSALLRLAKAADRERFLTGEEIAELIEATEDVAETAVADDVFTEASR
ncbi:AAA family ATPase [Methylosinus sp. PW1]|uniref:AAA family ATPase n=1 Tax=Methylosinus sp. PW1 TaxID=107636 RepID=UPI00068DA923|nr:AAA family ATPase [Methylosinus sp. PW1]